MIKSRKRYLMPALYRGIQIHKVCWAKSDKEAAIKLEVKQYSIRAYAGKSDKGIENDEIKAYMDSGEIIFDFGRKDLLGKLLPLAEMKEIIDSYMIIKYAPKP